uniref:Beta C1 protein n=1 Tax=Cotton leaf curl Multan betasatellite TaxID=306025 RepID=B9TVH7_9VIRU|nr:beta C1 protein [Cotton leaf curl Multan betasatellite]
MTTSGKTRRESVHSRRSHHGDMKIFIHMRYYPQSHHRYSSMKDRPVHVRRHTRSIRLQRLCRKHHKEFPIRIQRGKDRRDRDRRYSSQTCYTCTCKPRDIGNGCKRTVRIQQKVHRLN